MSRPSASWRTVLAVSALLGSLGLVTWRQARAFEVLEALDGLQREISLARAEAAELDRSIQYLESRARVVPEAASRLGMHLPEGSELELLVGGAP